MKTVAVKETQAPYTVTVDEAALDEGPVRVVHGEETLGVLVPPDEYEAFRAFCLNYWNNIEAAWSPSTEEKSWRWGTPRSKSQNEYTSAWAMWLYTSRESKSILVFVNFPVFV